MVGDFYWPLRYVDLSGQKTGGYMKKVVKIKRLSNRKLYLSADKEKSIVGGAINVSDVLNLVRKGYKIDYKSEDDITLSYILLSALQVEIIEGKETAASSLRILKLAKIR